MKAKFFIVYFVLAFLAKNSQICYGQINKNKEVQTIVTWVRNSAIPIDYAEVENQYSDLRPLKKILRNVEVISLGEASHGVSEFFEFKHRMIEFLVKELNFTCFTIESSYTACQNINDYILNGKGDLAISLANQGYSHWDTEEMTNMLQWMRVYNQSVPENKKVKFVGIDINYNSIGRKKVLNYFKSYAPQMVEYTDSVFHVLDQEDEYWSLTLKRKDSVLYKSVFALEHLIDFMGKQKDYFIQSSSREDYLQHLDLLVAIKRGAEVNSIPTKGYLRDQFMAENVEYVKKNVSLNGKVIVWTHNNHVSFDTASVKTKPMGYYLKNKLGSAYYGVGFEFYEGNYQARNFLDNKTLGPAKEFNVLPSPENSLGWYLQQTGINKLFLDLHKPTSNTAVNQWLHEPIKAHNLAWINKISDEGLSLINLERCYDGIFFINKISRAHPTNTKVEMGRF